MRRDFTDANHGFMPPMQIAVNCLNCNIHGPSVISMDFIGIVIYLAMIIIIIIINIRTHVYIINLVIFVEVGI